MDIVMLTAFFMWCSIINIALFVFWAVMWFAAPDLVYRSQRKWFPLSQETVTVVMYGFMGAFKIFILVFNVVPFIALNICG